tara:strand:+ start:1585 stop:1803 length:219 start_codon:yes stop_codon:yes gene_type:complete
MEGERVEEKRVLMVSISLSEYQQMADIVRQFNELLDWRSNKIEEYYKDRIENLERTVERQHERIMKLRELRS